jgi:hypothetical protein
MLKTILGSLSSKALLNSNINKATTQLINSNFIHTSLNQTNQALTKSTTIEDQTSLQQQNLNKKVINPLKHQNFFQTDELVNLGELFKLVN